MKTARNILWILFPVSIVVWYLLLNSGVINTLLISNIVIAIIFVIPITAMLVQTIMNKDKNLNKNYYILKMAFVLYLYLMIGFMFTTVLISI